jgi:hypothetical protein
MLGLGESTPDCLVLRTTRRGWFVVRGSSYLRTIGLVDSQVVPVTRRMTR